MDDHCSQEAHGRLRVDVRMIPEGSLVRGHELVFKRRARQNGHLSDTPNSIAGHRSILSNAMEVNTKCFSDQTVDDRHRHVLAAIDVKNRTGQRLVKYINLEINVLVSLCVLARDA
jgi:hypothetical protein